MSHVVSRRLHGYQNRAVDLRFSIETSEDTGDFSNIGFRSTGIDKTGLTAADTSTGFDVDLTLTAAELDTVGIFRWELYATLGGEVRTLAQGLLDVDHEPTEEET